MRCMGLIGRVACPHDALAGARLCVEHAKTGGTKLPPPAVKPEDPNQRWRTPPTLGRALITEAALNHDAAADATNHLCPTWWSRERSALDRRWPAKLRIWNNPAFGIAEKFAPLQLQHMADGGVSRMLVLDRGAQWLEDALQQVRWWRFTGRVEYVWPPEVPREKPSGVTFGSVLLHFDRDQPPGFMGWRNPATGAWTRDRRGRSL